MNIKIGTQLRVNASSGCLLPGTRYYYLGPKCTRNAHLVFFYDDSEYIRTAIISIERPEFEEMITGLDPILCSHPEQLQRPEWLRDVLSIDFDAVEDKRYADKKKPHRERVIRKLDRLGVALHLEDQLLSSNEPLKVLRQLSKEADVHPYRFETSFFSYILHGRDPWCLMTRWHNNGRWDRQTMDKKFGRKPLREDYCFNWPMTKTMSDRCFAFINSNARENKNFRTLWLSMLRTEFGCKVIADKNMLKVYHEKNAPFPSYDQVYSVLISRFSKAQIDALFDRTKKSKTKRPYNIGSYTSQFANNLEAGEADVYKTRHAIKNFCGDQAGPELYIARLACCSTSSIVGIGFSVGGETRDAYRSMLFSAVAPRSYVEKLYGLEPGALSGWIQEGLPGNLKTDRGPAGWDSVLEGLEVKFPIKGIAPSGDGQAKAIVESSHPRGNNSADEPSFYQSDQNVIQVIKQELLRVVHDNRTSSVLERLSDSHIVFFEQNNIPATPDALWNYNSERGRHSGWSMSLERAVKSFWTPIELSLGVDGVRHFHHWYSSTDLLESGALDRLGHGVQVKVKGYRLNCSFRFMWVEIDGKIIEVEGMKRMRVDDQDYALPISALTDVHERRRYLAALTRQNAQAGALKFAQDVKDQTGLHPSIRRKMGRKPTGKKIDSVETGLAKHRTSKAQ